VGGQRRPARRASPAAAARRPGTIQPLLILRLLLLATLWGPAAGLKPVQAQTRALAGQVMVGLAPADTGTVILHRVSPDFAGEVDSLPVGPEGRFVLPIPLGSQGSDVFFASVRVDGVLYFGSAIHDPAEVDSVYTIQAYAGLPMPEGGALPIRVRNLFVEASDSGWTVTDLFEVSNQSGFTLVPAGEGDTWSHALPEGASGFRVGQSDLTPDRTRLEGGRLRTTTPVLPGESIYLVQYHVPDGPLSIPSETPTERFELLFREPGPEVSVTGLAPIEPVEVEGTTYRRFAGNNLPPTVVRAEPGTRWTATTLIPWLGAGLALVLAALGGWVALRGSRPKDRGPILVQVARLDEDMASGRLSADEYEQRRRRLLDSLSRGPR